MSKGQWRPYSNVISGKILYIPGRQLSLDELLHAGNIEYCGTYSEDKDAVQKLCDELNRKEKPTTEVED